MQRVHLNVKYGLYLIIIYRYCFINCNKYTTLIHDVDERGNWEGGSYMDLSRLSSQFSKSKTVLKNKVD